MSRHLRLATVPAKASSASSPCSAASWPHFQGGFHRSSPTPDRTRDPRTLIAHSAPEGADRRAPLPFCNAWLRRPAKTTSVSNERVGRATWAASPREAAKLHLGWLAPVAPFLRSVRPTRAAHVAQVRSQESGKVRWAWPGRRSRYVRTERMARRVRARVGFGSVVPPRVSRTPAISCKGRDLRGWSAVPARPRNAPRSMSALLPTALCQLHRLVRLRRGPASMLPNAEPDTARSYPGFTQP